MEPFRLCGSRTASQRQPDDAAIHRFRLERLPARTGLPGVASAGIALGLHTSLLAATRANGRPRRRFSYPHAIVDPEAQGRCAVAFGRTGGANSSPRMGKISMRNPPNIPSGLNLILVRALEVTEGGAHLARAFDFGR
jgi:hypothetical protein